MLSDFNYNFGFVVEEIFELGYIKSRCFENRYKTWSPQLDPHIDPSLFLNDGEVSRLIDELNVFSNDSSRD